MGRSLPCCLRLLPSGSRCCRVLEPVADVARERDGVDTTRGERHSRAADDVRARDQAGVYVEIVHAGRHRRECTAALVGDRARPTRDFRAVVVFFAYSVDGDELETAFTKRTYACV